MTKGFKCSLCLAGLSILLLRTCYYGQESRETTDRTDVIISEVNTLVGRAALSLGNARVIETETMPGLLRLWHERRTLGAINFDLSNAFLFAMEENPEAFFSSMSGEPTAFSEWLKDLPDLSFTWSNAPPCQLEAKREQLILILEHAQIRDAEASRLKGQVYARLSAIRCRQIQ